MRKIEQVYREILYQAVERDSRKMTQLELSKKLSMSLSTVNLALKKLERMNAVRVEKMNFSVVDIKKILYFWASIRNLEKDILWKARADMPAREIERNMPPVIWAGYSAYKFRFKDVPADYSEVYVYSDEDKLSEIKKRFPENKKSYKNFNLLVLKKDANMSKYEKTGTMGQIFVDLWNLRQWYAGDFLKALEERLNG